MESSQTLRNSSQISQKHHQYNETFHHHHHHQPQAMKNPSHHYSSRRTHSFSSSTSSFSSSSSSLSSYNPNAVYDSPLSTPSSTPRRFSGKPFSWEYFPGIPKKKLQDLHHTHQCPLSTNNKLLPLPPPTTKGAIIRVSKKNGMNPSANPSNNKLRREFFESDPFFAALVECSKADREARGIDNGHDDEEDEESMMSSGENFGCIGSAKGSRRSGDRFGLLGLYASCKRTCAVAESIRRLPRPAASSYDQLINVRSSS